MMKTVGISPDIAAIAHSRSWHDPEDFGAASITAVI
jgi:hypothetical protein